MREHDFFGVEEFEIFEPPDEHAEPLAPVRPPLDASGPAGVRPAVRRSPAAAAVPPVETTRTGSPPHQAESRGRGGQRQPVAARTTPASARALGSRTWAPTWPTAPAPLGLDEHAPAEQPRTAVHRTVPSTANVDVEALGNGDRRRLALADHTAPPAAAPFAWRTSAEPNDDHGRYPHPGHDPDLLTVHDDVAWPDDIDVEEQLDDAAGTGWPVRGDDDGAGPREQLGDSALAYIADGENLTPDARAAVVAGHRPAVPLAGQHDRGQHDADSGPEREISPVQPTTTTAFATTAPAMHPTHAADTARADRRIATPADPQPREPHRPASPAGPSVSWRQTPQGWVAVPHDTTAPPTTAPNAATGTIPPSAPVSDTAGIVLPPHVRRSNAPAPTRRVARPRSDGPTGRRETDQLIEQTVVRGWGRTAPTDGWRRMAWELTGGRWNPGLSAAERRHNELVSRVQTRFAGSHKIAVISVKGGVGKTTVTACLGRTLADHRGDRVLVMDANPDFGTLADRLTGDTSVTVQHLLDFLADTPPDTLAINDIEQFTTADGRLRVLAGGQEPVVGHAFTRDEYEEAIGVLSRCYNIVITDSGTGVNHSAMEGTLAAADAVVIVGAPTVDAANRALVTLEWLTSNGHAALAANAVVVMSLDRTSREIDHDDILRHFAPPRCRAVVEIPADPHLETGGRIDLDRCRPATREAFLRLAADLADAFTGAPLTSARS